MKATSRLRKQEIDKNTCAKQLLILFSKINKLCIMFYKFKNSINNLIAIIKVIAFILLECIIIFAATTVDLPLILSVLTSNVLTFMIALYASKSFKLFTSNTFQDSDKNKIMELEEKLREEKNNNIVLKQTRERFSRLEKCAKLVLLEKTNSGYLVRNEKITDLNPEISKLFSNNFLDKFLDRGEKKVLYIDYYDYKSALGVDLNKIKYSKENNNRIYICGVEIKPIIYSLSEGQGDVDVCWVYSEKTNGNIDVKNSSYTDFKTSYRSEQRKLTRNIYESDDKNLCTQMTASLQKTLTERYPNLIFVSSDDTEHRNKKWRCLFDGDATIEVMNAILDIHTYRALE